MPFDEYYVHYTWTREWQSELVPNVTDSMRSGIL